MKVFRNLPALAAALTLLALACRPGGGTLGAVESNDPFAGQRGLLPTGVRLDPEGSLYDIGQFPLNMVLSPDGSRVVLLLNGWRALQLKRGPLDGALSPNHA